MKIHLVAVGERAPAWVEAGYHDFAKRLTGQPRLVLRQIKAGRRTKGADIARVVRAEGERLLAAVPKGSYVVALDRAGRELSTDELAAELRARMARGGDMALLIGGPEGLSDECLACAHARWSLSRLTLAHPLARVVAAEQIYRAWSIINELPYHR
ncbi:MAG TPA: 23S rRNA (pseudouridine(1915)-N(3))-methyltransferase RlmH [Burkholderiales bacterium]